MSDDGAAFSRAREKGAPPASGAYDSRSGKGDQYELAQDNRHCVGDGETLRRRRAETRPADKNKLFKELDFNKATFSKLAGQKHINRVD